MNEIDSAYAIAALVEANMAQQIFLTAVEKGFDPRDFELIVGGGAGPVHAFAVAAQLGMKGVYIPNQAAVFCALGSAMADYKYILSRFLYRREDEVDIGEVRAIYNTLEEEGATILKRQGVDEKGMTFIPGAEMRYFGQLHDIEVLLPGGEDW